MRGCSILLIIAATAAFSLAQGTNPKPIPRFEDYSTVDIFKGAPASPILSKREERRYRTVIRQGVSKGWGLEDGRTGAEWVGIGPNFAGRYFIITWGCGAPCLMAAIVDAKNGRVFPPPFHDETRYGYFQVPWEFPEKALDFRRDSRLLIANICESTTESRYRGRVAYQSQKCGAHYFVMGENGLTLVYRVLE